MKQPEKEERNSENQDNMIVIISTYNVGLTIFHHGSIDIDGRDYMWTAICSENDPSVNTEIISSNFPEHADSEAKEAILAFIEGEE